MGLGYPPPPGRRGAPRRGWTPASAPRPDQRGAGSGSAPAAHRPSPPPLPTDRPHRLIEIQKPEPGRGGLCVQEPAHPTTVIFRRIRKDGSTRNTGQKVRGDGPSSRGGGQLLPGDPVDLLGHRIPGLRVPARLRADQGGPGPHRPRLHPGQPHLNRPGPGSEATGLQVDDQNVLYPHVAPISVKIHVSPPIIRCRAVPVFRRVRDTATQHRRPAHETDPLARV